MLLLINIIVYFIIKAIFILPKCLLIIRFEIRSKRWHHFHTLIIKFILLKFFILNYMTLSSFKFHYIFIFILLIYNLFVIIIIVVVFITILHFTKVSIIRLQILLCFKLIRLRLRIKTSLINFLWHVFDSGL